MRTFAVPLTAFLIGISGYLAYSRPQSAPPTDTELKDGLVEGQTANAPLSDAFRQVMSPVVASEKRAPQADAASDTEDAVSRLRTLPQDQLISEARRSLGKIDPNKRDQRVAIINFLKAYMRLFPTEINRLAIDELESDQLKDLGPVEWTLSYVDQLSELYLGTVDTPAHAVEVFGQIAEIQPDGGIRRRLMYHFITRFPEIASNFEDAAGDRVPSAATSAPEPGTSN